MTSPAVATVTTRSTSTGLSRNAICASAVVDGVESRCGFALVRKIRLGRDGVGRDAQCRLENALVQQHDVQFALQRRKTRQDLRDVRFGAKRQQIKRAIVTFGRGVDPDSSLRFCCCKPLQKFHGCFLSLGLTIKRQHFG